jgi:uncharacterized membrane protein YedE/YeeE
MDAAQLAATTWAVLLSTLALSVALGAVMHASHFCTMGAISDAVLMQDTSRLKQWALAAAVAILGFAVMHYLGWIDPRNSIYGSPKLLWLTSLFGGGLFGVGMVLASGCTSKALVRLGAGNLKSFVVLLVTGVFGLATLKGLLAMWRVNMLETVYVLAPAPAFFGTWLAGQSGWTVPQASAAAALCMGGALGAWSLQGGGRESRSILWAGLSVGAAVVAMWWITGVLGHGLEHPETLEEFFVATSSGRMESLSFTSPVAMALDAFMYFSDGTKRLTVGMVSVFGVVLGAYVHALWTGSFRWEGFVNRADLVRHVVGAALMGVGGVTAMGCTIGQGLSGLSTLSWMSALTLISIGLGACLTLTWQFRQLERKA